MILIDSSVWIDYLRYGDDKLEQLLHDGRILTHPFVIGEVACGEFEDREKIMGILNRFPKSMIMTDQGVLSFIERNNLMGRGIGYIDMHILAATWISASVRLWTRDKRLKKAAEEIGRSYDEKLI